MNAEELIRILSQGEGPHVEFKSDFPKQAHENSDAIVVDGSNVRYGNRAMSYNEWGQKVTGWVALNIYKWVSLNGKTLGELRSKAV